MTFPDVIDALGRAHIIAFWVPLLEHIYYQRRKKESDFKDLYSSYFSTVFSLRPKRTCLAFCVQARSSLMELEELQRQQDWHCRHLQHVLSDPAPLRSFDDFKHQRSSERSDGALVLYVAKEALVLAQQGVQVVPAYAPYCLRIAATSPSSAPGSSSGTACGPNRTSTAAASGSATQPQALLLASQQPPSPAGLFDEQGPPQRWDTADMNVPLLLAR